MEDIIRKFLNDNVTLVWITLIVGFCWFAYIPRRNQSNRSGD
ncbi:MAG TPA: hypothetical protein V6D43_18590 [Candidatus Sericytochromatia bacterium]|jgi:hypothetical protein